ncbi:Transcriptional regulator, PadR family [Leucobacter sp. 7(1)]|uniref:PadR family transcriptional regulator n=1 Tax=Leucobacter sp. 7(1) TaxID=1255613 RepID=UPI00097EB17D|nr:PadR family transcriptional regulator [Leucobacter sp. 7(1)]SJN11759.1 Transcriptional regulator, PadR family [Leucobacter sp. 7(1)]
MSLRAALLALISGGPLTGYDAVKHFRSSVGHVWHAPDSQIYPELRRLQAEGLLAATEVPWGTKQATKTQYALTEHGAAALREWQSTPLSYVAERDQPHLLAAYFEWGSEESARARLIEHIAFYTAARGAAQRQIREIEERTSATLARRLRVTPEADWDRVAAFKRFAYEGKIARAEAEVAWAERGLDLLSTFPPE